MERARVDFGGNVSNGGGYRFEASVCVGSAEASEGLYDEFRIR